MLSCRINQIQWTLRKAGRHKGFEDGLAVAKTSTHLEASLIMSSKLSALFLFRIRSLSFSLIFHPSQFLFMKYVLPTLSDRKRKIRSAVRLSPRSFPIGVCTKKCIDERSASGGGFPLSEKYYRGNSGLYPVLQKVFISSFNAIGFFWKNRFRQKTYTAYHPIYPLRPPQ